MGLKKRITSWFSKKSNPKLQERAENSALRRCQFEVMEPRLVLSADPVVVGVTYHEGDTGQDNTPDHFDVTFQGGSPTTQLATFTINGDQDLSGSLTDGDMFFDVDASGPGAGGFFPFEFDAQNSLGLTASDIVSVTVGQDGLSLTVQLRNFEAGDRLAFNVDVDEVERLKTDKIASGVEFEGTYFTAQFADQHYDFSRHGVDVDATLENGQPQHQQSGIFYDTYDQLLSAGRDLAGATLNLDADNFNGQSDRSAATIEAYDLTPKPVVISGQVYHDENLNCERDSSEQGIGNVNIVLQKLNEQTGRYQQVAATTTNSDGQYAFGANLGLMPGTYRIVESQPNGYLDVAASAGDVEGLTSGVVSDDANGNQNIISNIVIPLGGNVAEHYDFKEVRPASIAGNVWHDRNDNGRIDSGEEGIANVLIQVTRMGPKDTSIVDPFAAATPIFVRTAADGSYSVDGLPPGIYDVVEINNYPIGANPLAGFIDGKDSLGNIGGVNTGTSSNDRHTQIELCAGDAGVRYDFGELKPTSISGHVSVTTPEGNCLDPNDPNFEGISGVTMQLFDAQGNLVATTQTNADGFYEFAGLRNGIYTVVEVQPNGYLDGSESAGTVNGASVGSAVSNDRISSINLTSGQDGINYDFCEHRPAQICGTVWHDIDNDGIMESGEQRIGGVLIELFDNAGNKIAETRTDAQGGYCFNNLYAGTYCVKESQPGSFVDGKESLGSVNGVNNGVVQNDQFCDISVLGGQTGSNYNFGEIRLASLSGTVFADTDGDCVFEAAQGDTPLAGATLILLNEQGSEVARTQTDANGNYSFNNLMPGTYTVRELTPNGYLDGGEFVGQVNGVTQGTVTDDRVSGITLNSGATGTNYNFCEHVPAELCGTVYHDRNNNGVQDSGEEGIGQTRVVLYDTAGNIVADTTTDANGDYCFKNLIAGEYCVTEFQPVGFRDGIDSVGTINGAMVGSMNNDQLCNITIRGGQKGTEYNFGEIKVASLSGFVHTDSNGNCVFDSTAGEKPIAGVQIQLLNNNGIVIGTTQTAADGSYAFNDLLPGTYSVRQIQPNDYFSVGQVKGQVDGAEGTGNATQANLISNIVISSGQVLTQYNFCEDIPAEIHGRVWEDGPEFKTEDGLLPANYRDQRDGVYQAGVDKPIAGVVMRLYYFNDGVSLTPRPVTLQDVLGSHYPGLTNPNSPITTVTDANGQYHFTGLRPGSYIVLQEQPTGYSDANEVVGSTTGFSFNSLAATLTAPQSVISTFSQSQIMDSLVNIFVAAGGRSVENNFTEVRVTSSNEPTFNNPPLDPPPPHSYPAPPSPPMASFGGLAGSQSVSRLVSNHGAAFQIAAEPGTPYSWHLSVINAGMPRAADESDANNPVWLQASYLGESDWTRFEMDKISWSFGLFDGDNLNELDSKIRFGMLDGIPLAGDFDGDGIDEVAIYKDGYWMIDLNRNGAWDQQDLLARLGTHEDDPVVGDWDGDGKDDIGIYGPIWEKDADAIARDPGLPNPDNRPNTRAKNIPPTEADSTSGARFMKLTSYGRQRADLIDHVFGIDDRRMIPVTGDWNGNGIRSIGTFEAGSWRLDVNGDGEFDGNDTFAIFGETGDLPAVGDFDGDGIEQIAVYRAGTWIIDTNHNQQLDDSDSRVEYGEAGDRPVVGDWNGDGVDDLGLYRTNQQTSYLQ